MPRSKWSPALLAAPILLFCGQACAQQATPHPGSAPPLARNGNEQNFIGAIGGTMPGGRATVDPPTGPCHVFTTDSLSFPALQALLAPHGIDLIVLDDEH
jgi:hypothetical protein